MSTSRRPLAGQRMAERDRAAVDVDALEVDLQRLGGRPATTPAKASLISHRAMSRGLEAVALEQLAGGLGGAQVQRRVGPGDDGAADDLGQRVDARGRAVVISAAAAPSDTWLGVAGGDRAVAA